MAENSKEDVITFPKHLWEKESKELRTAIYDDWRRKAINDAKFRAVEQNVDYPTFANLAAQSGTQEGSSNKLLLLDIVVAMCKVSVAHLKPVERKMPGREDEERPAHDYKGMPAPAWSFNAAGTDKSRNVEDRNVDAADGLPALLGIRKQGSNHSNQQEKVTDDVFAKNWRHLKKDVFLQMVFLTAIDPGEYPEIFKVEIPPNLLADILATVCTCFKAEENARDDPEQQRLLRAACTTDVDENWVIQMLEAMAECGRFSLSFKFVGEKTRAMIRALIARLIDSEWCKTQPAEVKNPNSQHSRLSRIINIAALYRLELERKPKT